MRMRRMESAAFSRSDAGPLLGGALVIAAVVAFDPGGWAPFGPAKWLLIPTLVLASGAVALRRGMTLHRGSALGWAAFLGWGVVASVLGREPVHTWIGTPERHLGLATVALFAVAFFAGQQIDSRADRRTVARAAAIALLGAGAYSLLELAGLDPVTVTGSTSRIGGPFGSPAYLGAAVTLLAPLAAAVAADRSEDALWRTVAGIGSALGLVALVASGTRGAWVGMLAAVAVSAPAWWPVVRRRLVPVAVAVAVAAVAVALLSPAGDRVASAFDFEDGGGRGRVDEWSLGVRALGASPLVGYGFEGYRTVVPEYVTADYALRYGREVAPDRSHNGIVDVGLMAGVPGALAAAAAGVWLVFRSIRATRSGDMLLAGAGAAVTGYLVQQFFLFPLAELDPVMWLIAGSMVAATVPEAQTLAVRPTRIGATVAAALAVVALAAGALDLLADRAAAVAVDAGRPETAHNAAATARRLRPDSIRYAFIATTVEPPDAALDAIGAALAVSPHDPILLDRRAALLLDRYQAGNDPAHLAEAVDAYRDRVAADPHNAGLRLQEGITLALSGDTAGAEASWLAAADLAPTSTAPLVNLATLYSGTGRADEALAVIEQALAIAPDDMTLQELADRIRGMR